MATSFILLDFFVSRRLDRMFSLNDLKLSISAHITNINVKVRRLDGVDAFNRFEMAVSLITADLYIILRDNDSYFVT